MASCRTSRVLLAGVGAELAAALRGARELEGCTFQDAAGEADVLRRLRRECVDVLLTSPSSSIAEDLPLVEEIARVRPSTKTILLAPTATPEGVIAACALKALGGSILGRLAPRNDEERREAEELGYDLDRILTTDDLVASDDVFFAATGISDGELVRGVRYSAEDATASRKPTDVGRGRSRWRCPRRGSTRSIRRASCAC